MLEKKRERQCLQPCATVQDAAVLIPFVVTVKASAANQQVAQNRHCFLECQKQLLLPVSKCYPHKKAFPSPEHAVAYQPAHPDLLHNKLEVQFLLANRHYPVHTSTYSRY